MNLPSDIGAFAESWLDAWNAHDLERVLRHFADDAVFLSPFAARILPESDGVLRGKAAVREYWTAGLAAMPELHFEIVDVFTGVDTVVINYRNQSGGLVNEVMTFKDGLVVRGEGTYLQA
ncbi:MAG TPA: nuclear transport factor 2 family protein [Microbacteriaceae bacterium]|nr:nuclear transport factor 2 family protein [Microbacteriaceae bacterium]